MEFKSEKLANGLDIIAEVNKSAKSTAVGFFVKAGSRDETEQVSGVSHFLEHMLFKGTERLNAFEVNEAFDRTVPISTPVRARKIPFFTPLSFQNIWQR